MACLYTIKWTSASKQRHILNHFNSTFADEKTPILISNFFPVTNSDAYPARSCKILANDAYFARSCNILANAAYLAILKE